MQQRFAINNHKNRKGRGNILFLILLAVVLFAALAYAVTSSMRGGGKSASDEQVKLYAAELIQNMTAMKVAAQRLYLMDDYKQVLFNDSAPTNSGTCYINGASVTPCKTIGLFHSSTGIKPFLLKSAAHLDGYDALADTSSMTQWHSRNVQVNGAELGGTTATDEIILYNRLSNAMCAEINRQLYGDPTPGTEATITGSGHRSWYTKALLFGSVSSIANGVTLSLSEGCINSSGSATPYYIIFVKTS